MLIEESKITGLKDENKTVQSELNNTSERLTDLESKLSTLADLNAENKKHLDTMEIKNSDLVLELESLRSQLRLKQEHEVVQANKIQSLEMRVAQDGEIISNSHKTIAEGNLKVAELELRLSAESENYKSRHDLHMSQIECLNKENQNLMNLVQEKITDQEMLAEKQRLLVETKTTLEQQIHELIAESSHTKTKMIETTTKLHSQISELTLQIESLSRDLKTSSDEVQNK